MRVACRLKALKDRNSSTRNGLSTQVSSVRRAAGWLALRALPLPVAGPSSRPPARPGSVVARRAQTRQAKGSKKLRAPRAMTAKCSQSMKLPRPAVRRMNSGIGAALARAEGFPIHGESMERRA